MANSIISALPLELAEGPAVGDLLPIVDVSDTTDAASGTTKKIKGQYSLGSQVNAQTGTTYTYLTTDFRKLVTHTNASPIAGTLPQASATFPAGWHMFVQNRGAGALTITPTTSTIDGAASLVLNQNEGALVVSDGTNYFSMRGKATGGVGGVGDFVGPASSTDNAVVRHDGTTGKLGQDSVVIISDAGAITVPEIAAPSTPAAGTVHIYAKSDGKLYIKDDAGTETDLTGGGGSIAPLVIESANVVAQRNGVNAQSFLIYGTFTDASNYERLFVGRDGSNFVIRTEALGTGTVQQLQLRYGATRILAYDGGTVFPDANNVTAIGTGSLRFSIGRFVNMMVQTAFQFEGGGELRDGGNVNGGVTRFGNNGGGPGTWAAGVQAESLGSSNLDNFTYTSNAHFQRWSSGAAIDVTGMVRGQVDGQTHLIVNVGSNNITLKHDVTSTAANRFLNSTGADIVLSPNQAADVIYDTTTQRWRAFKRN